MKPPKNFLDSHEKFLIGVATKGGNGFFDEIIVRNVFFFG